MRIAKDGSLQLYYSRENAVDDQDSIQRISHDDGATWGEIIAFSGHGILARDGMLGLAEFRDEVVAVFETNEDGPMHIKAITSPGAYNDPSLLVVSQLIFPDDGKTWHNRHLVYRAINGVAAAPQIAKCGGVLVINFQTDEDGQGTCMKTLCGRPGNWHSKVEIGPPASQWGGIMALDEFNAVALFDHEGCKTRRIFLREV